MFRGSRRTNPGRLIKKRAALIITGAFFVPLQAARILIKIYKALYMFHTF
jgi:hypothetical protein